MPRGRPIKVPLYMVLLLTESWVAEYEDAGQTKSPEAAADTEENIYSMDIVRQLKYPVELIEGTPLQRRLLKRAINALPQGHSSVRIASQSMS